VGILLGEHDMELVRRVCDFIYVLDVGKLIFEGTPAGIAQSVVVQAAYLGSDEVMAAMAVAEMPEQEVASV
jgi:ABC-type branched-subunit amino acid transport system ATPase component